MHVRLPEIIVIQQPADLAVRKKSIMKKDAEARINKQVGISVGDIVLVRQYGLVTKKWCLTE